MFGTNETKVELGLFMCSVSGGMKMRCLSFHGMVDGDKMRCNEIHNVLGIIIYIGVFYCFSQWYDQTRKAYGRDGGQVGDRCILSIFTKEVTVY